ncbi:hypothetical protein ROZALSC1DRAFT_26988 [Rozella allomycis CSF55]|uniref:NAD(P)-binding domain-containing protein n=1 Tax=Rozella allomycis (strain CSF55) TaxID=988480 RepID=A0A4V1J0H9_ROZAC|nr:hypothetical protein ROZALSC1DRAFT_26988 [Rozella allomycis CSF55]
MKTNGLIVNISSLSGIYPFKGAPVYSASKAGIVSFTRALGDYAKKNGIRIACLCPSFAETKLLKGVDKRLYEKYLIPISYVIKALEIALDDRSINGVCLRITPEFKIDVYPKSKL